MFDDAVWFLSWMVVTYRLTVQDIVAEKHKGHGTEITKKNYREIAAAEFHRSNYEISYSRLKWSSERH